MHKERRGRQMKKSFVLAMYVYESISNYRPSHTREDATARQMRHKKVKPSLPFKAQCSEAASWVGAITPGADLGNCDFCNV